MASSTLQTAYNDWRRRAGQFSSAGIPQYQWEPLYQRDMAAVQSGSTPMTDAEIYAAVQSANKGPQIADPQPQHGHGGGIMSILSGVENTIGNIPRDIQGIITGFPAGIAHLVAHFPSEVTNTGELLYHLAEDDNSWLQQKGYLPKGTNLHPSWSGFATILRALDTHGNKQLLPYLPGLADLANLTSGQGRVYLEQHPVGALLDILPGVAKLGKIATAGRLYEASDFATNASDRADLYNSLIAQGKSPRDARMATDTQIPRQTTVEAGQAEPRFWAAGRALQAGNPIKALVSAAGDIIPAGEDQFGVNMSLRQRSLVIAHAAGIDKITREGPMRGVWDLQSNLKFATKRFIEEKFGKDSLGGALLRADPQRLHNIYLGTHGVNPSTGKVFADIAEYNDWVNHYLDPAEVAAISAARDIVAEMEAEDMKLGKREYVPNPRVSDPSYKGEIYPTTSRVYKTWQDMLAKQDRLHEAMTAHRDAIATWDPAAMVSGIESGAGGEIRSTADAVTKARKAVADAAHKYNEARFREIPEAWMPAVSLRIRQAAISDTEKRAADQEITKQEMGDIVQKIEHSTWESEYRRLLGDDRYQALKDDAVNWWTSMAESGFRPLWTQEIDQTTYDHILDPKVNIVDKAVVPSRWRAKKEGVYFGNTVHDIAASLTESQVEVMRYEAAVQFMKEHIIGKHTATREEKIAEYTRGLQGAQQALGHTTDSFPKRVSDLINENFVTFDLRRLGINPQDVGLTGNQLLIDRQVFDMIKKLVGPGEMKNWGGQWFRRGTSLYKFAVLTGPRHLAHVALGGLMFMMLREPLAPLQFANAAKVLRGTADPTAFGAAYDLLHTHHNVYELGDHSWGQFHATGQRLGEDNTVDWVHRAKQAGVAVSEFIPNRLAHLEETIMSMYRVSTLLSAQARGLDEGTALEMANRTFVDLGGMSYMERYTIKQIFPFYAFTRHLFRYLFQYPVDYPMRAAMITNFAEQEQADWNNGLPRSYMSLFNITSLPGARTLAKDIPGMPALTKGDQVFVDLKNINPFRSFANDFTWAGFTSSLSPFLTGGLAAIGVDTLSGSTQLYPGTMYNPQTGTLQATPPPGGMMSLVEAFVPQAGLLDHYLQLTQSTRMMAKYDQPAYQKQLFNMLNVPFVPEVVNVPYEQEMTEIRRFRQAQTYVGLVEKNPTPANVAKMMEFNLVPWNNELIAPAVLAQYWERVKAAMVRAGQGSIAPKVVVRKPPTRKAQIGAF